MPIIRQPPRLVNRKLVEKYLEVDLWTWMREVCSALSRLNFTENFQAFLVKNLSIPAGAEVSIPNQLPIGQIPTGRLITRQSGDANIIDGDSPWTQNFLYLKNPSMNDAVVSVLFFQ